MTIRTRLNLWYSAVLCGLAIVVMGAAIYSELVIEQRHHRHPHKDEAEQPEQPGQPLKSEAEISNEDLIDILTWTLLPGVALGVLGGWWLTRRALAPVTALTEQVEKIQENNLGEKIPRSANGDELDRLTEVFNAMTGRLNESFNRIREFTLHASHELKTPLTILRGETETVLRDESLSATERERTLSQLEELQRLTRIVDGLTLLAKADAGQVALKLEPVRLDELVKDIFADTQILAEAQAIGVKLAECEEITVRGDRHRLRQLLLNLADNAVKYNQPRGGITLDLRRAGEGAEFTISNTGAGIPADKLPRVFDRFFRGDPAHGNAVEGCGLGLSIAQWIVSAHGGVIHITSEPGKMTEVTVTLPALVNG
jgi:signal transduction histidine kinase